jgi:hypothetical protein
MYLEFEASDGCLLMQFDVAMASIVRRSAADESLELQPI